MRFLSFIFDTLAPLRCLGCGIYDVWLCQKCSDAMPLLTEQHCPVCKKHTTSFGENCFACAQSSHPLDGLLVASFYRDTLLQKALHYYKYRFIRDLDKPLATLLRHMIIHTPAFPAPDIIIPVPLHARRLRWRGFNQAALLAHAIIVDIPIEENLLARIRYTQPQMTLSNRASRLSNLDGAFVVIQKEKIIGKTVLLIDDITTTGATLTECAKPLKDAGAAKVYGLVLARE